jgi:ABC-type molybdate transport system ATPase subunit
VSRKDLTVGSNLRLRIAARNVSLTLEHQSAASILNLCPATDEEITDEGHYQFTAFTGGCLLMQARVTRYQISIPASG